MQVYLVHPTGNQNSRQLAIALASQQRLQEFATALAIPAQLVNNRFIPSGLRAELQRRCFETAEQMRSVAIGAELARLACIRLRRDAGRMAVDNLYQEVDRCAAGRILRTVPTHVYAYEDGALGSFEAARAVGARTFYELPIGHWQAHRALCDTEQQNHPEWAHTWALGDEPEDKLQRKDEELAVADRVIVPSEFVKSTLLACGTPAEKIVIVPYGCPPPKSGSLDPKAPAAPLRILFVGGLSQRKGLSDLVEATSGFGLHVQVTAIGRGPARSMLPVKWRVIDSLPHAEVLAEMRHHDVFIFPTRFEGRSLAVAEAVSCGLALITTRNSGAADLVEEGVNGWLTSIGDTEAISAKIELLLSKPDLLLSMKAESLRIAAQNSWTRYSNAMNTCLAAQMNV